MGIQAAAERPGGNRAASATVLLSFLALVIARGEIIAQEGHGGEGGDEEGHAGHEVAQTDENMVANAMAAAPEAVAREATIAAIDEEGRIQTVREGTGSFTCIPDNPGTPGNDPMCMDRNAMEWLEAYIARTDPPADKVGFGYMLMGGSDASNRDPYATEPAPGNEWIDTGPHVMIFGATDMVAGYPEQSENPDPKKPYVMWAGTPYAHLMIPVR